MSTPSSSDPEVDYQALHLPGNPDQTLFVYRAPDGDTASAEALAILAKLERARSRET